MAVLVTAPLTPIAATCCHLVGRSMSDCLLCAVCSLRCSVDLSRSLPLSRLWSWTAFAVYVGWLLLHFVLYLIVPGSRVSGVALDKRGNRLHYPINGEPMHSTGEVTAAAYSTVVCLGFSLSAFACRLVCRLLAC